MLGAVRRCALLVGLAAIMAAPPVAELLVAIKVAQLIGVLNTVLLLIVTWPVGVWAMRTQGRAIWRRFQIAVSSGRQPGREVLDGVQEVLPTMTFSPPWTPERMSEDAKFALGF